MSLASRSPKSRKSLSAFDQNIDNNLHRSHVPVKQSGRRGVVSMGGEELVAAYYSDTKADDHSLKGNVRRHLQPRKSILKSISSHSFNRQVDEETVDYTQQYAHTVAFGLLDNENIDLASKNSRQSLGGRRVSFAPNAHVRMFERQASRTPRSSVGIVYAESTPTTTKSSQSRRSSIQNIGSISKPNAVPLNIFQGEGESLGEESMEIEDEDSYGVEVGAISQLNGDDQNVDGEETMEIEEEDMDMDMTQHIYGGIIRQASMTTNGTVEIDVDAETEDEDGQDNNEAEGDEEKTMDFTIAVGGFLPPQAPVGATSNRNSIGYSFTVAHDENAKKLIPGEAIEGEDYVMEETEAYGQIIGQDVSFSSGSEDTIGSKNGEKTMTFTFNHAEVAWNHNQEYDDNDSNEIMEMTTSVGGNVNPPPVSPSRADSSNVQNTRPLSGTPSFARQTISSARKSSGTAKRNVFAPSPSPLQSTTPNILGMRAAEEVAKRLSFGSIISSEEKKRMREDPQRQDGEENTKRNRINAVADEMFGITLIQQEAQQFKPTNEASDDEPQLDAQTNTTLSSDPFQSQILSARQSSLGTAMRLSLPDPQPQAAIPEPLAEEENNKNIEDEVMERQEHEIPQNISLSAFLEMTGVQFLEGLPGMLRRRSSVAKGVLGQSYSGGERDFSLHEYTEAQVNNIFLNMYTWAANKLRDDIKTGNDELSLVSARCDLDSPPVIQEYLLASDEDKQLFEMTFKSYKTNTHLKAREMWYDWKWQLLETIKPDVESMLNDMKNDNKRLTEITEQTTALLPQLRARQIELQAELQKERDAVVEIATCDQGELATYKEAIAEQSAQINNFSTELADSKSKLFILTCKLQELNAKRQESVAAINHAKSQCDQYTRSDAIRLQEEYTSLQHLHLWNVSKSLPDILQLTYDAEITLSFTCHKYVPDISSANLVYLDNRIKQLKRSNDGIKGESPTKCLFEIAKKCMGDMVGDKKWDLSTFVLQIGLLWSRAQRLRAELRYLAFHHPLAITFRPEACSMQILATVMIKKKKSKVMVTFEIDEEKMRGFPGSLASIKTGVKGVYGTVNINLLEQVAKQTVQCSRPEAYLGTFLQVCVEVRERYTQA
ncbi:hypothetical protein L204_104596 [Cryptococcus depauperatus]|nr:hypothetical protein L204_03461 [Cryptococcus depauperatus CBS 7855]